MTHREVFNLFEKICPVEKLGEEIDCWFPNGKDSVRVRLVKHHRELIFTYKDTDNWRIETAKSYISKPIDSEMELYIKEKLKILDELGIIMTDEQRSRMMSMDSEIQIDNFAHYLIMEAPRRRHVSY